MANETGKRYSCSVCGAQFVVIKGGDGTLKCCGTTAEKRS